MRLNMAGATFNAACFITNEVRYPPSLIIFTGPSVAVFEPSRANGMAQHFIWLNKIIAPQDVRMVVVAGRIGFDSDERRGFAVSVVIASIRIDKPYSLP